MSVILSGGRRGDRSRRTCVSIALLVPYNRGTTRPWDHPVLLVRWGENRQARVFGKPELIAGEKARSCAHGQHAQMLPRADDARARPRPAPVGRRKQSISGTHLHGNPLPLRIACAARPFPRLYPAGSTMESSPCPHPHPNQANPQESGNHCLDRAGLCQRLFFLGFHLYRHSHWSGADAGAVAGGDALSDCRRNSAGLVPLARTAHRCGRQEPC